MDADALDGLAEQYDVVVVGGGAAGLAGAVAAARMRRSVLVVDAGEPRSTPATGVHGAALTMDLALEDAAEVDAAAAVGAGR